MSKVKIVSIIYAIGIIIGALFFNVWGADTTPFKTFKRASSKKCLVANSFWFS